MKIGAKNTLTRRDCLKHLATVAAFASLPVLVKSRPALAQVENQPTEAELATITDIAQQFLARFKAPGLSIAIGRDNHLLYRGGFGYATAQDAVTPDHLFRIASVSKPLTSVAIFTLIERGDLALDDFVFGPEGHLQFDYGKDYPNIVNTITFHHLLTHTCGGWHNTPNDPMFQNPTMNHQQLIAWTLLNHPLEDVPGEKYAYSNFGYCVLGRLIEKLSKQPYAQFVQEAVLSPCDIEDMRIAGNTAAQRAQNEVVYFGQNGQNPYNLNVTRTDSHGGWLATPSDMVKFALRVDGFSNTPDLLSLESEKAMTTATTANPSYACGWSVNRAPNWWHGGSLPGTETILVRTSKGLCWAAFVNTRTEGIGSALDQMMWQVAKAVPAWHA